MTEETQVSEVAAPVEAAPTDEKLTPATQEEGTTPSEGDKPESEPKAEKTFTQAELDEILQKRLAKEQRKIERLARLEAENMLLKQQSQPKSEPAQSSGEPKPEQFDSYEKYIDALTDYKVEQKLGKQREVTEQERSLAMIREHEQRVVETLQKAAEKYDDFDEVITNPNLAITPVMRDALGEVDNGGDVAYHLGINPKEAERIAKLPPARQVIEVSKLSEKLAAPPKVSNAPSPPQLTGKAAAKSEPDPNKMTFAEYEAWRRKNGARWA